MTLLRKRTIRSVWRNNTMHRANKPLRFLSDNSGATAVVMALMLPVMILGMGIGAETGYQYMTQRKLQHIADLSAHAGAARLRAGDNRAEIEAASTHVAVQSGFPAGTGTITISTPPSAVLPLLTKTAWRSFWASCSHATSRC